MDNGGYKFTYVDLDEFENYTVEFEYNGMKYEPVKYNADQLDDIYRNKREISSKALDTDKDYLSGENFNIATESQNKLRAELDKKYSTITYDDPDIEYDTENNRSTIHYEGVGPEYYFETSGNYNVVADTRTGRYDLSEYFVPEVDDPVEGDPEMKWVNLGIKEREQPDLAVRKDIYLAKVEINGRSHVYKYRDRMTNVSKYGDGHDDEPKAKFQGKYSNLTYSRNLYPSDVMWTEGGPENELKVSIVYEIEIKNYATTLNAKVNQIVDYYHEAYKNIQIGTTEPSEETGYMVVDDGQIQRYNESDKNGYHAITIDTNFELGAGEGKSLYVMFEIDNSALREVVNNDQDELELDNITEITSYTTMDENGNLRAGVDRNSRPGNTEPGNVDTYENDTDRAPALKVNVQNENRRETLGKVFLDDVVKPDAYNESTAGLMTGFERKGNGVYDDGEKGIGNVRVQLVKRNSDGTTSKVSLYNEGTKEFTDDYDIRTDTNGEYTLGGFVPDNYEVEYYWGSNVNCDGVSINIRDYKQTIYNERNRENDTKWYKATEPRYSDAFDDFGERQDIDHSKLEVKYSNSREHVDDTIVSSEMRTYTPDMDVRIEDLTKDAGEKGLSEYGTYYENTEMQPGPEEKIFKIENVDFGIVERPKQEMSLTKHLQHVKLTLDNTTILIDVDVKKDPMTGQYSLAEANDYTVYLPEAGGTKGSLKMELDKELAQGAELEITYAFEIENLSELDYENEEYYKYGTGANDNDLVKLMPGKMIDYLDNKNTKMDVSEGWLLREEGEIDSLKDDYLSSDGNLSSYLEKIEKVYVWEKNGDVSVEGISPGEHQKIATLTTLKTLTGNQEITLENHTELLSVYKSWGSPTVSTPGNYNPSDPGTDENDSYEAEQVIVVRPTGENRQFIIYTIIGLVSLGVTVAGIVLIKKKIIK